MSDGNQTHNVLLREGGILPLLFQICLFCWSPFHQMPKLKLYLIIHSNTTTADIYCKAANFLAIRVLYQDDPWEAGMVLVQLGRHYPDM